jgi:glycine cleavage system H lipoate-binding protein
MAIPTDRRYSENPQCAQRAKGAVGITDRAQELLGDLVFVERPVVGRKLKMSERCGRGVAEIGIQHLRAGIRRGCWN